MKKLAIIFLLCLLSILLFGADYGAIYKNYTAPALSVTNGTTPTYLAAFTVGSSSTNVTPATDKITVGTSGAGFYYVKFDMSFTGSSTAAVWEVGVYDENGTKLFSRKRYTGNNTSIGNISGSSILDLSGILSAKDLKIGVTHDNGSSLTYTPLTTHLTVYKVESDSSTPAYAELTASSGVAQAINTTTLPIDKFASQYEYPADDWTFDNVTTHQLTYSGTGGTFLVVVSSSFEKSNASSRDVTYSVRKNSTIDPSMQCKRSINNDIGNLSFSGIISLATNDVIDVAVTTTTNLSLLYNRTTMVAFRIDNASSSTNYGGIDIAGNSTATTFASAGEWNNIAGTFTSLPSNGFTQSGSLPVVTPSAGALGYYFAEFTSSITYSAISQDREAGTSIFKSTTNQTEFIFKRDLLTANKANDVASVGGVGILPIDNTDAISLKISNLGGTEDLVVPISSMVLFNMTTQGETPLPVTLSSFTAGLVNTTPQLQWTTQSEQENLGWNVYRAPSLDLGQGYLLTPDMIEGAGSVSEPTDYVFNDPMGIEGGHIYGYWIESISYSGESELFGPVSLTVPYGIESFGTPIIPEMYGLKQNHPNPFNPNTKISFSVENTCECEITIFDIKGRKLVTLFDGIAYAEEDNYVTWNGEDRQGNKVTSGIYYYRLLTPEKTEMRKMLLFK